jgi:hypothetical protein
MAKKDVSVIRIAVGSREGPKSGVWRIWAGKGKSDVYVAVRSYTGIFKVSLHESGECFVGLATQFAERNPSALAGRGGSRRFDTWWRITHSGSRLSIPFRLVFPGSELREVRTEDDQDPLVQWIEPPAQDQSVDMAAVFSGQCYSDGDWPLREQGARLLATFRLPSGEVFWLLYMVWPTFDFVAEDIRRTRQEMREPGNVTIGDLDLNSTTARLVVPGVDTSGVRLFVDAAMT